MNGNVIFVSDLRIFLLIASCARGMAAISVRYVCMVGGGIWYAPSRLHSTVYLAGRQKKKQVKTKKAY
jgi:hypothetical protein